MRPWWADRPFDEMTAFEILERLVGELFLIVAICALLLVLGVPHAVVVAVGCALAPALDLRARRLNP